MSSAETAPAPLESLLPPALAPRPAAPRDETPRSLPRTPFPSALRKFGSQPIYRVIEVTRDASGRLNLQGRIWHTDLDRLRRFGRALAANSQSHRVVIADSKGELVEELDLAGPEERQPLWGAWQHIPLPPAPPRRAAAPAPAPRPPAPRPAPVPPTLPLPTAAAAEGGKAAGTAPEPAGAGAVRQPPRDLPLLNSDVPGAQSPQRGPDSRFNEAG